MSIGLSARIWQVGRHTRPSSVPDNLESCMHDRLIGLPAGERVTCLEMDCARGYG